MTIEEKLEKAIEFIKSIEQMSLPIMTTSDIVDIAHPYCDECGGDCEINFAGPDVGYVEADAVNELKDKAWHLLANISE